MGKDSGSESVQSAVVGVGATGAIGGVDGGGENGLGGADGDWEDAYQPLPFLFAALLVVWLGLLALWVWNTYTKRRWQSSNLQWMLTMVPLLKVLVLALSCAFWVSCLALETCSFWVAFGVFVSRIFFETACFIAFLLIAHGYCITHEQLSQSARRSIAGLASLLYLTLTGYKAAVPQFAVLVVLVYLVLLYVVFYHCSLNVATLQEQLLHTHQEGLASMAEAVHTKYVMFKRFQAAMVLTVVVEVLMHARADGVAKEYWVRLLLREVFEGLIFIYIGWTFRSRAQSPFFSVIPILQTTVRLPLPPIYSVTVNSKEFHNADFNEWHVGLPVSPKTKDGETADQPFLVIIKSPGRTDLAGEDSCQGGLESYCDTVADVIRHAEGAQLEAVALDVKSGDDELSEIELEESGALSEGVYSRIEGTDEAASATSRSAVGVGQNQSAKLQFQEVELELPSSRGSVKGFAQREYAKLEEGCLSGDEGDPKSACEVLRTSTIKSSSK